MPQLTIVFWRDIPAQVIAREGRRAAKRELGPRFQQAIDRAAMAAGLHGSDDYLAAWRRGAPVACGDDIEAAASGEAARLEREFDDSRLAALAAAGGVAS